jgi:hypothetical protein
VNLEPETTESPGLITLPEGERARLAEALQELLATGYITGLENS